MAKNKVLSLLLGFMLIGILAFSIVYYFVFDKYDYPFFERIENIRIEQVDLHQKASISFIADLQFYNPSPISIPLSGLYSEIFINGEKTTAFQQDLNQTMPGKGTIAVPIRFDIPLTGKGVLGEKSAFMDGSWKNRLIDIRAKGTITIKVANMDMDIPFNHQKKYKLSDYLNKSSIESK